MGVAADDRHARLSDAQLRADDVHDALIAVTQRVNAQAEFLALRRSVSTWVRLTMSAIGFLMSIVGVL
jgi:hypothetical protein